MSETLLRPVISKTFVKGAIGIALFSIFLEVNASNIVNYLIFVLVSFLLVALYSLYKRSSNYKLGDEALIITRPLRASRRVRYADIADLSVSQGILARRFHCGTVFVIMKSGRGSYAVAGGGFAEALRDVKEPAKVYDEIASRLDSLRSF
jgi:hypothetical protein